MQIWSHRTHVDTSALDCRTSLELLHKSGINHFDVDVLQHKGRLLLAHPSELEQHDTTFRRAPCSNMDLKEFLEVLAKVFADDFYLTMEPKANWPGQQSINPALSEPKDLLDQLLVEIPTAISIARCGIILSPDQLNHALLDHDLQQLFHACQDLVYPLSIRSPFQLPFTPPYTIFMPTIEHFESLLNTKTVGNIPTILWVVDDEELLTKALELPNVHGVITNKPQKLQAALDSICT